MKQTLIEVNLEHEATHCWPNADVLPEVSYLKHPHRHMFHIKLRKKVSHNDRAVEIIMLKHKVSQYLFGRYGNDFGTNSCEAIADDLFEQFGCSEVYVLEDGENGAGVYEVS